MADKLTRILQQVAEGNIDAQADLYEAVYDELKIVARHCLTRARRLTDLHSTVLVHEAYLKLRRGVSFENRRHFFGAVGRAMQDVLVDEVRRSQALKRRGKTASLDSVELPAVHGVKSPEDFLSLHEALTELAAREARRAEVVRSKVFLGLTTAETAEALKIATRTVEKDWTLAKAWIKAYFKKRPGSRTPD